jgi:hypothetical protein
MSSFEPHSHEILIIFATETMKWFPFNKTGLLYVLILRLQFRCHALFLSMECEKYPIFLWRIYGNPTLFTYIKFRRNSRVTNITLFKL